MSFKCDDDYSAWLRLKDTENSFFMKQWYDTLSGKRDHRTILNRKRRQQFGPGRFWAPTSAGVLLNQTHRNGGP